MFFLRSWYISFFFSSTWHFDIYASKFPISSPLNCSVIAYFSTAMEVSYMQSMLSEDYYYFNFFIFLFFNF